MKTSSERSRLSSPSQLWLQRIVVIIWCNLFIENIKLIIQFLDLVEETRDLTLQEWNLCNILRQKLQVLLEQQKIYWKQRGNIKWATLGGDESTKFFHVNVVKHKHNSIATLQDDVGNVALDHNTKSMVLYEAYKDRLGSTNHRRMVFDLQNIIDAPLDLSSLESPSQKKK